MGHKKWNLKFENGYSETADFVIVANGGQSKVRKYMTDSLIQETGTFILQGDIHQPEISCPEFFRLCGGKRLMTSHNGNLFIANPMNNGSLTYGIIFKNPEESREDIKIKESNQEETAAFLSARLHDWGRIYHQLFHATTFFAGLPTRKIPINAPWKDSRPLPITLIGDAAHLMPPFAGQGVNIGLIDALNLSENLINGSCKTIEDSVYDYEKKMFIYAKKAQSESGKNEMEMRNPDFSFAALMYHSS